VPRFQSYPSALSWLYARNQFAIKLGLENPRRLLRALGNPEESGTYLHVAGTNGKGSVCAALAAMLPALGVMRVGLYTSPHLVSFRERIRVDGEPVPAAFVTSWLNANIAALEELNPTYFECVTAMAFAWFRERVCGAVVLETGLGGRLDATNVISPRVTVITAVSLDHTGILGDTPEAILREKLGIVKPGVPLVVDEARPGLARIAEETAAAAGAPLLNMADRLSPVTRADTGWILRGRFRDYALPADLRDEDYQNRNAALAVLALEAFHGEILPAEDSWIPALRAARMPGRMQRLASPTLVPVLLDGAHNPAAAEALCDHLRRHRPGACARIFFSVMRDKDYTGIHALLRSLSSDLVFVDLSQLYPRALSAAELRGALPPAEAAQLRVIAPIWDELAPLLSPESGADSAVFCGSLYLLGAVIPLLAPHYPGLEEFEKLRGEDGEGKGTQYPVPGIKS
jgi:dihydrofolate synthase/folylpolyglutamate synthase